MQMHIPECIASQSICSNSLETTNIAAVTCLQHAKMLYTLQASFQIRDPTKTGNNNNHYSRLPHINLFKDVLKSAIIFLKDGVLGAHVQWPLLTQCILEAAMCKIPNGLKNNATSVTSLLRSLISELYLAFPNELFIR